MEPPRGFEPRTYALRVHCSTPRGRQKHLNAVLFGHLTLHHVAPCWTENVRKLFALDPGLLVTRPTPYRYDGLADRHHHTRSLDKHLVSVRTKNSFLQPLLRATRVRDCPIRAGRVRPRNTGQIRAGQIRAGQIRSRKIRKL